MANIITIPEKKAIPLCCQKCGYMWLYTGRRFFASCSRCVTMVTAKKRTSKSSGVAIEERRDLVEE